MITEGGGDNRALPHADRFPALLVLERIRLSCPFHNVYCLLAWAGGHRLFGSYPSPLYLRFMFTAVGHNGT